MKKFQVTVNGNVYDVEVEEVGGSFTPVARTEVATPAAPKAAPQAAPAAVPTGATKVAAPMPGKIVDIKVSSGQAVKEGDVVAVLEAMKMENEVVAPCAGTIASINTSVGTMVETNDVIATIN
ncbi:acetyl-CoA carboxylase biotin carboxyl carrier protein subunit [Sporanaerobium hydrogeniformans]|uniref:Acetyl-CoA carboxylase biotin carboxyl carrier protein subunit n=1 Tax=Sporanaerobium hydrogeniformans TaxID=3072179 RepID=A0AC61DD85_9FIRM|nr:biotin/lipoyl-containing protein [Sporanaerobium hydrogeniformans]PHV71161.1 acetyl-CoA carboxylase biotin carboxyl carrier protein subunit [Sporanaerobium hydrogeniformans]